MILTNGRIERFYIQWSCNTEKERKNNIYSDIFMYFHMSSLFLNNKNQPSLWYYSYEIINIIYIE